MGREYMKKDVIGKEVNCHMFVNHHAGGCGGKLCNKRWTGAGVRRRALAYTSATMLFHSSARKRPWPDGAYRRLPIRGVSNGPKEGADEDSNLRLQYLNIGK